MTLTDAEKRLCEEIGFSQAICGFIKQETGKSLERVDFVDQEWELMPGEVGVSTADSYSDAGLSIPMSNHEIEAFMRAHQAWLLDHGYRAFWSERHLPNGLRQGDELIVLKTTRDTAIVAFRQTSGGNYDVSTGDIVRRLRQWEQRCKVTVVGASSDWVALEFETLPNDLCGFAEEIYAFCPDSVDQGVALQTEEDAPDLFTAARRLCADSGEEVGVKLLAHELQKSKYLFLWWD